MNNKPVHKTQDPKPTTIRSFRDLRVWQESMRIVEQLYKLTSKFPKEERYGLSIQLRRSAVSIPSNIAEGKMRGHVKEYVHFLSIAQGSLAEVETQIEIARALNYVEDHQFNTISVSISKLARQLQSLRSALLKPRTQHPEPKTQKPKTYLTNLSFRR